MNRLDVVEHLTNPEQLVGVYADESDASIVIDSDTLVYDENNQLVCAYLKQFPADIENLRAALLNTKIIVDARAGRVPMKASSVTFGYLPAIHTRNHPCRVASLCRKNTIAHEELMSMTETVADCYLRIAPKIAGSHLSETKTKTLPEYRIHETMFTSGIVNKSSQLPYHFDSGNFKGAWSAMLGLSKGIAGGNLVLPEYNLKMAITDKSICFFDGQKRVHGVTPIYRSDEQAERYTIVWYSLERLWKCLTHKDEIKRMNASQTKKNRNKRGDL